jgi:TRAP-type C4-dicarboxylate transport system permease small subunit
MLSVLVRFARSIHLISAFWVLLLAGVILVDVIGRAGFNRPFLGASEIIKNSVVSIALLQLPLAILMDSMLRTTVLTDRFGPFGQRILRTLCGVLGCAIFLLIAWAGWQPALSAFAVGEYEGEGALRVPTWPVRILLVATCLLSAVCYLAVTILDWAGVPPDRIAAMEENEGPDMI